MVRTGTSGSNASLMENDRDAWQYTILDYFSCSSPSEQVDGNSSLVSPLTLSALSVCNQRELGDDGREREGSCVREELWVSGVLMIAQSDDLGESHRLIGSMLDHHLHCISNHVDSCGSIRQVVRFPGDTLLFDNQEDCTTAFLVSIQ